MEEESGRGSHGTLEMLLLDAKFADAPPSARRTTPTVHLYGVTWEGRNVCCIINDFKPYFWFPAPTLGNIDKDLGAESLEKLRQYLDEQVLISKKRQGIDDESFVAQISLHHRTPLMYYRPGGPFHFLKVEVWRSKDVAIVAKVMKSLAQSNQGMHLGFSWQDSTCYEEDIKLGMRFFCDTDIAGGAWIEVSCPQIVHFSQQTTHCAEEFTASWRTIKGLTPDATQFMEFSVMQYNPEAGVESSRLEGGASTQHERNVSLEEGGSDETKFEAGKDTGKAPWLALSPFKIVILDVQCGKANLPQGLSSTFTAGRGKRPRSDIDSDRQNFNGCIGSGIEGASAEACDDVENISRSTAGHSLHPSKDPVLLITSTLISEAGEKTYIFMHGLGLPRKAPPGTILQSFDSEHAMLLAWQELLRVELDPDVICVYQLKDSIRYLVERFRVLKLGILDVSRCKGRATEVKSVVSYGKHWVKQQARMTATSNQEVFRAAIEGRVIIDVLRVVLVAYNLSTFTLAECCQVFLGKTKEVLNSIIITEVWRGRYGGGHRLMRYSLNEAKVTWELTQKLQIIPELIEMARVTGISISDSLYKAQMIRVQSLLLRSARKEGWLLGGPTINGQLSESPFLIHPKECKTAGFYKDPVAILDFASLYPSLYMAHNLCYTTLVHPEDVGMLPEESLMKSPTGAYFVVSSVRHGILPRICGALISARKLAKEQMAAPNLSSTERAVFDARQKALKLCSNALYGFTGAGASPQQALPIADSCLSMGAASCKHAVELVKSTFKNAKVLYAQTDSVFIQFCGATVDEAIKLGKEAADVTTKAFPPPMSLKFEKVLCPFLLLQVNRYAGKDVTYPIDVDKGGRMFVRGLESERRDVPPFVRGVSKIALQEILLNENVGAALDACKHEIKRLLSGKCSMMELIMTGGLWRVDDHDISRLASAIKSPKKESGGAATAEEGRGPHVALAVRLKRNDPERQFHIGERIPYVLVNNSSRLQDDMAEDPVNAIIGNMQLNYQVYLENKLRKPLESILEYVAHSSQIHDVFNGSHTVASPFVSTSIGHSAQASMKSFFKSKTPCLSCRKPLDGVDKPNILCKACKQSGASQSTVISLTAENREYERKLVLGQAACIRCHSGGFYKAVLCTNTDCPVFYCRSEIPDIYRKLASSIEKLELECSVNQDL
ncbi:hypothetical protein GOP47_0000478 [Adiantum capillus-veneris]|uniref:DNA polymerase delta catalytic subunit n=1 Tax=Adiantum capillus-veneris TaxID=13818 RepID=A0A9D4ZQK7_ADICA|nr:hypothetical protein GOP47_0000478 [Adiantum capillus-veneris]